METSILTLKCDNSSTFATFQLSYFPTAQPGIYRKQIWAAIRNNFNWISTSSWDFQAGDACPKGRVTAQREQKMPVPSDNPNPLVPPEGHRGHIG